MLALGALYLIGRSVSTPAPTPGEAATDSRNASLAIAYSPEKATLMQGAGRQFNGQKQQHAGPPGDADHAG